jgi:hypothetical protein
MYNLEMPHKPVDNRGLLETVLGDGSPFLLLTGVVLVLSGLFALFQSATGQFLPQDVAYLQMTAAALCGLDRCRIVHFMFHDRVSFGGALIAIGSLYLWLVEFPLRHRQPWAWWTLLVSGVIGFSTFLAYLGYGYLDTWHGIATLGLLPVFVAGILRSRQVLNDTVGVRSLFCPAVRYPLASRAGIGRICLLITSMGLIAGGMTIMIVGMTCVFVPQDLQYMGVHLADLYAISPRLVPLIAHDRAGFGGGLCSTGIAVLFCVYCGTPSRNLWQVIALAGGTGFACAIGIHPIIAYTSPSHLAPAVVLAIIFVTGLAFSYESMMLGLSGSTSADPDEGLKFTNPAQSPESPLV